jgi:integrase
MIAAWTVRSYLDERYVPEKLDMMPGSVLQLRIAVALLDEWHGGPVLLTDLSPAMLTAWMRWLGEGGRAAPTVNKKRSSVLAIWRHAAEAGFCSPPNRVPKRLEPRRVPTAWRIEDVGRLFAACDQLRGWWEGGPVAIYWRLGLSLIWDTGCRINEVLRAKVADVDLSAATWHVPAEGRKGRREDRLYTLHPSTVDLVRSTLVYPRQRLFPFPCQRRQLWVHLHQLLVLAGLQVGRRFGFHCLRRTVESYAAKARGVEWAAEAIGHSVEVARRSYISPAIVGEHRLIDAVPRPV